MAMAAMGMHLTIVIMFGVRLAMIVGVGVRVMVRVVGNRVAMALYLIVTVSVVIALIFVVTIRLMMGIVSGMMMVMIVTIVRMAVPKVTELPDTASGAEAFEEQAGSDPNHYDARKQAQKRVQLLRQYILRCKQRNQPEREHARSMGNGYRKTEERRMTRRAARPDEVSPHDCLPMAGRHRMQAPKSRRK